MIDFGPLVTAWKGISDGSYIPCGIYALTGWWLQYVVNVSLTNPTWHVSSGNNHEPVWKNSWEPVNLLEQT